MDEALPPQETAAIKSILDSYRDKGIRYHALRSRRAAARKFLVAHLLVPGEWSVQKGHQLAERIEAEVMQAIPNSNLVTHLEPLEDPASMDDAPIDREPPRGP